jgi:transposase
MSRVTDAVEKLLERRREHGFLLTDRRQRAAAMMARRQREQGKLFYDFNLDDMVPRNHLLRRINVIVAAVLADLHEQLKAYCSDFGRPSVDPELMIRMLIVGYCYGIRSERRLCDEVAMHLAYRWFCKMDLDDKVPHHSTFSVNRLGRFSDSDILRHIFERVVMACMAAGLVKGEGFAVDASVMEANASRYHGVPPDEINWSDAQKQKRAVRYNAATGDCRVCTLQAQCCPGQVRRRILRDVHEYARDVARRKMKSKAFIKSRDERKRVEMRFAHLKTHHRFERMRLRGLSGARDEFHLAAIVQNLKTMALRLFRPPPAPAHA